MVNTSAPCAAPVDLSDTPLEIVPRDLSAYRKGNTGVEYVHRFDSGKPGPHVLISALTHGNEFCGMVAACDLLDRGVRPEIGTLTVTFNNVAAYESFDPARPFDSRQIVHNLNRIFSAAQLDGSERSPELDRARQLRPVVNAADHVLDIHSTSNAVAPFIIYPGFERNERVAMALSFPHIHLVMPTGMHTGVPLTQCDKFGLSEGAGAAMVVECGQHFLAQSGQNAIRVTQQFLAHFGLTELAPEPQVHKPQRFKLLSTHVVQHANFAFARPVKGFETFAKGELIATDGNFELRAPVDDCTLLMPPRQLVVGREACYLTEPMAA
jgi:predicted deacylase